MKKIVNGENIMNVPNLISFCRLLLFPVILVFALTRNEQLFAILLVINLVADIFDGLIARSFGLVTRFGAALDNLADIGIYILALLGIFMFKWTEIQPHAWLLYLFLAIFVLSYIVAFVRFGKIPGMHLYSSVLAGYLQGTFFFVLFVWGFNPVLYYIALGWGVFAYIEKTLILARLDDIRPGVKGLYWLIKSENSG
jgi:cardiolipin synthase (CMP-forming)